MYLFLHTNRSVFFMSKDTREYIIDEAYKLFLNKSYEAVSISIISDAIGFTKGALYHHFKSKEELFRAVIDKYFTIPVLDADFDKFTLKEYNEVLFAHTVKILRSIFHQDVIFVPVNFLGLITDAFRHYNGFAEEKMRFINHEVNNTILVLENAIKRGEIRPDINTKVIAAQYLSSTMGMAGDIILHSSLELTIKSLRDQFDEFYKLLKI